MAAVVKPIAYLALNSDKQIASDTLYRSVARWFAGRHHDVSVSRLANDDPSELDGTIMTIGGFPMLMIPIARRLPLSLFVDDVAQNHVFPGWRAAVDRQVAHIIITPLLDHDDVPEPAARCRDDVRRAAWITLETASALSTLPDAVGAYWGPSGLFHDRAEYGEHQLQRRKTNAELMVRLRWFGRPRPAGDGFGIQTQGMALFAGRELIHPPTDESPDDLYGRVLTVCSRMIESGPVITDGCTVGRDAEERFRIVFDQTRGGADILRLDVARALMAA
jgi:hypothetical protein